MPGIKLLPIPESTSAEPAFYSANGLVGKADIDDRNDIVFPLIEYPSSKPVQYDAGHQLRQIVNPRYQDQALDVDNISGHYADGSLKYDYASVGGGSPGYGTFLLNQTTDGSAAFGSRVHGHYPDYDASYGDVQFPLGSLTHYSTDASTEEVTLFPSAGSSPYSKDSDKIDVVINLLPDDSDNVPALRVEGLVEVSTLELFQSGPPEDPAGCADPDGFACFEHEHEICKARAQAQEALDRARVEAACLACGDDTECCSDATAKYDPDSAYQDCLDSCVNGTDCLYGERTSCADNRYPVDGGRLPDIYHIEAGHQCGCGSDDDGHIGCQYVFLATYDD